MDDGNIIIAVNVSGSGIITGYIAFDIFYKAYQVDFSSHKCIPPDTCLYFIQEVFLNIKTTIDASFKELMLNDKIEKAFLFNPGYPDWYLYIRSDRFRRFINQRIIDN